MGVAQGLSIDSPIYNTSYKYVLGCFQARLLRGASHIRQSVTDLTVHDHTEDAIFVVDSVFVDEEASRVATPTDALKVITEEVERVFNSTLQEARMKANSAKAQRLFRFRGMGCSSCGNNLQQATRNVEGSALHRPPYCLGQFKQHRD